MHYTNAPQSVRVDHPGHACARKVPLDDAKQRHHTMEGTKLDNLRNYQIHELTPDKVQMCNQLHIGRALEEAYVFLDGQQRTHSGQLETMSLQVRKMMDRQEEDIRNLEGLLWITRFTRMKTC